MEKQKEEYPKIAGWVYTLISMFTVIAIFLYPLIILSIWILWLSARFCSKYANKMNKNNSVAYLIGWLLPLLAGIYYLICWNYYIKNNNISEKKEYASKAVWSLFLGILAIFFYLIPGFGILPLVWGILGIKEAKNKKLKGKTQAIWGIVLGTVSIIFSVLTYISIFADFM